jgi:hypothetical protein
MKEAFRVSKTRIIRAKEHGVPDWYNEGFKMQSWDDGWFASANWGSARAGLWRLSEGGDVWTDTGKDLPVPAGMSANTDVMNATVPEFSVSNPLEGAFTAVMQHLAGTGGDQHQEAAQVRYATDDGGHTWRISRVDKPYILSMILPSPPSGTHFLDSAKRLGCSIDYDDHGKATELTIIRGGRTTQRVRLPLRGAFDRVYTPTGATDLGLFFGEIREPVNGTGQYRIPALFRSSDEGRTWRLVLDFGSMNF